MGIEELRKNVEQEKRIIFDMNTIKVRLKETKDNEEKKFFLASLNSLMMQLRILNEAIPSLLGEISPAKKLSDFPEKKSKNTIKVSYISPVSSEKRFITINKNDKENFLKELKISETALVDIKKDDKEKNSFNLRKPSIIITWSNKLFLKFSEKITPRFSELKEDLKRANLNILPASYISLSMFTSLAILILSLIIFVALAIIFSAMVFYLWAPFVLTGISLIIFYVYPAMESGSLDRRIGQELPFATIHMAAIAGAEIEPSKIFNIIANSREYPTVGKEMKKIINQIDLFGLDLITALGNVSKQTPNSELAELFHGISTNIQSGGDLKNYLEKKAENLLMDYRLERERYNDLAGTFMDIYISVLITAPLVLMMLFIIMNISGMGIGLSIGAIMFITIGLVALINIVFLVILQAKQPRG